MSDHSSGRRLTALAMAPLLLAIGCGRTQPAVPAGTPARSAQAAATDACGPVPRFDSAAFPAIPHIDNQWFPLRPGARFTLEGQVRDEDGSHHHRIVTTVTDLTKVVDGVRALVIWDQDYNDGVLEEGELFFNAQDRSGAVWNLGEYPEEYDPQGRFTGAPNVWIAGMGGAEPGIGVPATAVPGSPGYRQGRVPAIKFFDCAKVFATGQRTKVPAGDYANVLVTDEWGPLAPADGHQRKYYAPGVGNVRVGAVGGESKEDLMLTKVEQLCANALAKVGADALKLDRHGRELSKGARGHTMGGGVYGQTPAAERTVSAQPCTH
ncbi:MAG: hypothetical protein QOE54_3800 [Streptosporangiaceae bacterium]|nr:hypothetical protein [Streptosporangiaceae bacterium]MDX6431434.1 hypothetical protein [Streptosporangiaceae bacterium]